VLRVTRGRVAYRLADPDQTIEVIAGGSIVIEPEARHAVALSEDAAFFVEFHG
jgi:quercetin dioxygenase-like cupin family protein